MRAVRTKTASVGEYLLRLVMEPLREGGYVATSPDLPGLVAQGRSIAETMDIARDVARKIIESHLEHGDPLPPLTQRRKRKLEAVVPVTVAR
jgi:predicted RNase H-like HicB family nuclease